MEKLERQTLKKEHRSLWAIKRQNTIRWHQPKIRSPETKDGQPFQGVIDQQGWRSDREIAASQTPTCHRPPLAQPSMANRLLSQPLALSAAKAMKKKERKEEREEEERRKEGRRGR